MSSSHRVNTANNEIAAPDPARDRVGEHELDRKVFQLGILYELSHELNTYNDPQEIFGAFLLTAMGAVGATMGFVLMPEARGRAAFSATRGLDPAERERLQQTLGTMAETGAGELVAQSGLDRLIVRNALPPASGFPVHTAIMLGFSAGEASGLFGLGPRLTDTGYGDDDVELLSNLLNTLGLAVARALASQTVQTLYQELKRQHRDLAKALNDAEKSRKELDQRIFYLNTVYETAHELSLITDANGLMYSFVLALMGTFCLENGYLLFLDQHDENVRFVRRGANGNKGDITAAAARHLLFRCLSVCDFDKLTQLGSQLVPLERLTSEAGADAAFPESTRVAILCRVDDDCLGLVGLGPRLTTASFSPSEIEVLLTLVNNFLVFLKNVRSFEMIQALNRDLERRNAELQATLDELTLSRGKIEMLERAGAHVKAMLSRQAERIDRVGFWDFFWLAVASLLLGLVFNATNPAGVELVPRVVFSQRTPTIALQEARQALASDSVMLIDARPAEFYDQEHITGAVNVPSTLFDFIYGMKFGELDFAQPLVIYGRNISRLYDEEVAARFAAKGHDNIRVLVLDNDLSAWKSKGFPITR